MKQFTVSYEAPKVPRGCFVYEWATELEDSVTCILEYTPADGDGWNLPHTPDHATLCEAWVRGMDLYFLLTDKQIEDIEMLAMEKHAEQCRYDAAEYEYERRQEQA